MSRWFRWIAVLAILSLIIFYGYTKVASQTRPEPVHYLTTPLTRGELSAKINATGTVEPEDLIDVGAQVAGKIIEFGKDTQDKPVDYGSEVKAGQVLARIDDVTYQSQVRDAEAALASAKATLLRDKADLLQLEAKLGQAERDWERAKRLGPSEALARSSYDQYQSAYEVAQANVEVGKATIEQAKAGIAQAEATLDQMRQNLGYCTINSPVDGVIIDRRVNIGQTVVASQNAPSLFLVAKDLRRVQIWVSVNEADIGLIKAGQPVRFTVDAFPDETFTGSVGKVRLNASMTSNVVTYTVEVKTDNSSGRLLPYLTASVDFITEQHEGVFLAPRAALRWSPAQTAAAGAPGGQAQSGAEAAKAKTGETTTKAAGKIWILDGGSPRPVTVTTGASDDTHTIVESPDLKEGMAVITGQEAQVAGAGSDGAVNPFVPKMPRGARRAMR